MSCAPRMLTTYQGPVRAPFSLRYAMTHAVRKKLFDGTAMTCSFCSKRGHAFSFCPVRPTVPPPARRVPFADRLLSLPPVDVMSYRGFSWAQARSRVCEMGEALNSGNPWTHSKDPLDALRSRLGFWKAIGAPENVLSWLAYGLPLRFYQEPSHFFFENHPSYYEHADFVDKELSGSIASGYFIPVQPEFLRIVNPMQAEPKGVSDFRLCNDMRWVNAFIPNYDFRMQTLRRTLPDVVEK